MDATIPDIRSSDSSEILAEREVRRFGCFTTLTCRRSLTAHVSDDALTRLKQDWAQHMGTLKASREPGLENKFAGNCVTLALPDAIPERLWQVTYLAELTTHLDDITEVLACRDAYHDLAVAVEFEQPLNRIVTASDEQELTLRELLRPIVDEMLALDRTNTMATLAAWKGYFASLSVRQRQTPLTIDEYIPHRLNEFGCTHWLAMLRFSMDLHLSEEQMEEVDAMVTAAMVSVVLTNDWHSWPKELAAYQSGRAKLCNAVAVLMKMHSMSAEAARDMLRTMAIDAEQTYTEMRDRWKALYRPSSVDVVKYVDAVGALAAGISVWSACCPRYNSHRGFSVL